MQRDSQDAVFSSLQVLSRTFFPILGISVIIGLFAYGIAKNIPGAYEVHYSYLVSMEQKEVVPGFQYDRFYELSSIDLFSATLASVASSPEIVIAAYNKAGIEATEQDAIRLVREIDAEKAAPQHVRITVRNSSKEHAERLARGLMEILQATINTYNDQDGASREFRAVATEPWTGYSVALPLPIAISFFVLVFLGGNFSILLREVLRRGSL